jgi:hypothetical protein
MRADLHRHAARDFAHRRQQRQRAVGCGHGLVGDRGRAGRDQRLGLLAVGRQVQVREQHLAAAQLIALGQLRLLDLHDQVGGREDLGGRGDRGARGAIMRILEADAGCPRRSARAPGGRRAPAPARPAGTMPTRYSWILISFGTPIFMGRSLRDGRGLEAANPHRIDRRARKPCKCCPEPFNGRILRESSKFHARKCQI